MTTMPAHTTTQRHHHHHHHHHRQQQHLQHHHHHHTAATQTAHTTTPQALHIAALHIATHIARPHRDEDDQTPRERQRVGVLEHVAYDEGGHVGDEQPLLPERERLAAHGADYHRVGHQVYE